MYVLRTCIVCMYMYVHTVQYPSTDTYSLQNMIFGPGKLYSRELNWRVEKVETRTKG